MALDPYRYFRVEARELLDQLGRGVLDLEKGTGAPELVPRLLRLTHTLKGAGRVVRQREIADQAHVIEGVLTPFREAAADIPRDRIEAVLKLLEGIGSRVAALALPADPETATAKPATEKPLQTVRADVAEIDVLLHGIAETHAQMRALRRNLRSVERARDLADLLVERQTSRRSGGDATNPIAEELREIFRGFERSLGSSLDQMDRELLQVRSAAEQLRLVPVGALFPGLELTARDTARALHKRAVFAGRGGDVRLDAHVLGALHGALLQIVRNAVAHGIESQADRITAGKPADGQVTLDVSRRGRLIAFRCADDGRGVDLEAVRRAAQRRGLPAPESQRLDVEALLRLLLRGGISTSSAVTEVAGRGIGLDIVRETIERLGGEVSVRTEAGKGTTVELTVPLSVASLEALVVQAASTTATIPLDAVRRTVRLNAGDVVRTAQGESVFHDGKVIPFVPLSRLLQRGTASARAPRSWSAVIVQGAGSAAAVGVDRLLGTANIVFRPLPDLAPSSPVVAGVSLDAEGNPQLVLDSDNLVMEAQHLAPEIDAAPVRTSILVIDDSLTTRMLEQSILESADFEVGVAASAEEALEAARGKRYALFLVDVEMPGMDGFTFIERARADPVLRDIPAILVTSRTSAEDRQRGKEVGAQGYIVKSEFDQAAFLEQVRRLVG
jgi:two-component system chemotaxis sensor kinase CheA